VRIFAGKIPGKRVPVPFLIQMCEAD